MIPRQIDIEARSLADETSAGLLFLRSLLKQGNPATATSRYPDTNALAAQIKDLLQSALLYSAGLIDPQTPLVKFIKKNVKTMNNTQDFNNDREIEKDLLPEYNFDYSKALRNRFAGSTDTTITVKL